MTPHIENYEDPQIGDFFMVRCVLTEYVKDQLYWFPVFSRKHRDGKLGLDEPHYHIDWRFIDRQVIYDQEAVFRMHYPNQDWVKQKNIYYFTPVNNKKVIKEEYKEMKYLRDFGKFPEWNFFSTLQDAMKDSKMINMKCPHHGTNLVSCKPVDGVVTCPQHGLKWDVKTGELVL